MRTYNTILIYLILWCTLLFSCKPNERSLENIFGCKHDKSVYVKNKSFENDAFQFFHPQNWTLEITKDETYTSYVFMDSIEQLTDEETLKMSDEEFNDKYSEYLMLTLTQGEIYTGFNYDKDIQQVFKLIQDNKEFKIISDGISKYNGKEIKWLQYSDESYFSDSLKNECLTTCLQGEKNYLMIQARVFGNKDIDKRLCKLLETMNTITVK